MMHARLLLGGLLLINYVDMKIRVGMTAIEFECSDIVDSLHAHHVVACFAEAGLHIGRTHRSDYLAFRQIKLHSPAPL